MQGIEVPTEITFHVTMPQPSLDISGVIDVPANDIPPDDVPANDNPCADKVERIRTGRIQKRQRRYKPLKSSQPTRLLKQSRLPLPTFPKAVSADEAHSDSLFSDVDSDNDSPMSPIQARKALTLSFSALNV